MSRDHPEATSSSISTLFAYKAWANEELFASLATVDSTTHPKEVHGAVRVLNHVHVVDCVFKAHLEGVAHAYSATNTKETPTLSALASSVKDVDKWFINYVADLPPQALVEQVRFTFTDGDAGLMTREEILLHVITHGGYHRGAAGQLMSNAGASPPRDLYTRFLHQSEPSRRA